jgi:hypothetical protein
MTENTEENKVPLPTDLQQTPAQVGGNPLSQYFRHPKFQIELPTGGKFWPEGTLELKEGKFLEVMPMTARDEIIMKSPEGLLSGTSVAEIITSCIPGIKNAWDIPSNDLDTILISVRLASYDHDMDFKSVCPHCEELNQEAIDLRVLLDSIPKGDIKNVFTIGDLTFEFNPYTFRFINDNNKAQFEQEQLAKTMASSNITDDEKKVYFHNMFGKLAEHNTETLVIAINKISMPNGIIVTDRNHIKDFVDNTDRDMIKAIREKINSMGESTAIKPIKLTCQSCEKDYTTSVEFNQANFFE